MLTNNKQVKVDYVSPTILSRSRALDGQRSSTGTVVLLGGCNSGPFCLLGYHAPVHPDMGKILPLVPDATDCVEMNTNSPTLRLSFASLHFLRVLSVARNSSLQGL